MTAPAGGEGYFGELVRHWRPLLAASLGAGVSLPLFAYVNTVFAPYLLREFGWSRSDFALVGVTSLATLLVLPFIGRFTDRFGVRRVAALGAVLTPLCFVGYASIAGSLMQYVAVATAVLLVGAMTSPLVYTRLIAENFSRAQGLALTVVNCTPAVLAIGLVPALNWLIAREGWRTGYLAFGGFVLVVGLAALWLVPPGQRPPPVARAADAPSARADYRTILTSRVFWIITAAMTLCMLQAPLHATQMNIMLLDNGLTDGDAALVVSVYAAGTIIGRIACGLALDRYATPLVAFASMVLPALGYALLGTSLDAFAIVAAAMFLVGISVGAESDLVTFLIARYFSIRIYNTTLGLLFCAIFGAGALGALLVSLTLARFDSFSPLTWLIAAAIGIGSLLFLALPRSRDFPKIG